MGDEEGLNGGPGECGQPGKADLRASYQRHLPHRVPEGFPLFLTWNLKGSLPRRIVELLELDRKRLENESRRNNESNYERGIRHAKMLFDKRDRCLDTASDGPMYLKDSAAAEIVVGSIVWGVPKRYDLYAFVVMGNHVHVLLTPKVDLQVITQGIKGYTAHEINGLANARGRIFWQDESFDHWARDEEEIHRIIDYIENNPVRAGLCQRTQDWPWSSATCRETLNWDRGQPFQEGWKAQVRQAF